MIPQGQEQEKLPPFMFVSKIAKISNDKFYINVPKAMWSDVQTVPTDQAAENNN